MRFQVFLSATLLVAVPALAAAPSAAKSLAPLAKGADGFRRGSALPKWAQPLADIPATTRTDPVVVRLNETQSWVGATPGYLVNRAIQVNDKSALAAIGQFGLSYQPAYQKLALHRVAILRKDQRIDHTASVNARALERETGIESGTYSGATTLQLLLSDVRVGDTLWITYSVEGENPVFGKRWAAEYSWDLGAPVELRRLTVLHPTSRPLKWRQLGDFRADKIVPKIDRAGDIERIRFEGAAIEPVEDEPSVPADYFAQRSLQFSEYEDWNAVAAWADGLFPKAAPSPALKALAQQFGREKGHAAQASAALRWVQDEIRYFSVSIGENSHRPQVPDVVLKRRYGDCKDKSYLLVSLLAQLGIEARPVLLSTEAPLAPGKVIASPTWFNHVLVQVRVDGRDYYVDPTSAGQPQPLALIPTPFPGAAALVVDPASTQLIHLPGPAGQAPSFERIERLAALDFSGAATLETRDIYRAEYADSSRTRLPAMSVAELKTMALSTYEKRYPGITLEATPEFRIDNATNQVEVISRFKLPKAVTHKDGVYSIPFEPGLVEGSLNIPAKLVRNFPLQVARGRPHSRYRLELSWPRSARSGQEPHAQTLDNPYFHLREEYVFRGSQISYMLDYRLKQDTVAAAELPALQEHAARLKDFVVGRFSVTEAQLVKEPARNYSARDIDSTRLLVDLFHGEGDGKAGKQVDMGVGSNCDLLLDVQENIDLVGSDGLVIARRLEQQLAAEKKRPEVDLCRARLAFARGDFAASARLYRLDAALKPDDPASRQLAWASYYAGSPDDAVDAITRYRAARDKQEFGTAHGLDLADQIALLQRAGKSLPPEVVRLASEIPDGPWPRPLLAMQVGAITPAAMLGQAEALPLSARAYALTEAWFYLGQHYLAQGDKAGARNAFAWLNAGGIRSSVLYRQARVELQRLDPPDPAYTAALQAAKEKNKTQALALLETSARGGNANAQVWMGGMLLSGDGMPKDIPKALYWFQQAAAQGSAAGQFSLGLMHMEGTGVAQDAAAAAAWYARAAAQHFPPAQLALALCLEEGNGVAEDLRQAIHYTRQAAEGGNGEAQRLLALRYRDGDGIEKDLTLALLWTQRAANRGNLLAVVDLGWMYHTGTGVEADVTLAARTYRMAADAGSPDGQVRLGGMYESGTGVAKDLGTAIDWYRKAAQQGNIQAMQNLGYAYFSGTGVGRDDREAFAWNTRAAEGGSSIAQYNLALAYRDGRGAPKDLALAFKWFLRSAENGDADAQYYVGEAYEDGEGIAQDAAQAAVWYAKGAAQGDADSQLALGRLYEAGRGVPEDAARAVSLFKLAAEQGNLYAQYRLALAYETGSGITRDEAAAASWYAKAAANNSVEPATVPAVLETVAGAYLERGKIAQAEALYRRLLAARERQRGPEHEEVAKALDQLAGVHQHQGSYALIEPLYRRALAIRTRVNGPQHESVAWSLVNLAQLSMLRDDFAMAEQYYRQALPIVEKAHGNNHLKTTMVLNGIAQLYYAQGKYQQAEPIYKRVLAIREAEAGPDSASAATSVNNLGYLYLSLGQYEQAEPLMQRVLELAKKRHAQEHHDVATGMNNLGTLYTRMGKYAQAEALCTGALAMREKLLGPDHAEVAISLNSLGILYGKQGRAAQSDATFQRALAIREKTMGAAHTDVGETLNDLALMLAAQRDFERAEPLYQRALAIRKRAFGTHHPDYRATVRNLAALYRMTQREGQAAELEKLALASVDAKG